MDIRGLTEKQAHIRGVWVIWAKMHDLPTCESCAEPLRRFERAGGRGRCSNCDSHGRVHSYKITGKHKAQVVGGGRGVKRVDNHTP